MNCLIQEMVLSLGKGQRRYPFLNKREPSLADRLIIYCSRTVVHSTAVKSVSRLCDDA